MCPFPFPISLLRGPASLRQRQELFLKDLWLNCRGVFLQQTPWSALCCVASYYGHSELSTVAHTLNNILSSHQPAGQFPEIPSCLTHACMESTETDHCTVKVKDPEPEGNQNRHVLLLPTFCADSTGRLHTKRARTNKAAACVPAATYGPGRTARRRG